VVEHADAQTENVDRRTPCNHEHACIRCPMLRVDPKTRPRLAAIIENLRDRIDEARVNGWLGEIQGLQISLDAAAAKMATLDRAERRRATGRVLLGLPSTQMPRALQDR
jgi:hypothetical protein